MINTALNFISIFLKCREINGFNDEPYLERYSIIRSKNFNVYLHKFLASDPDRGLHDHPFKWNWSFILYGHYNEQTENGYSKRQQFSVGCFDSKHKHRVVLTSTYCWTIFAHGPRVKGWGFFNAGNYKAVSTSANDNSVNVDSWAKSKRKILKIIGVK